MWAESLSFLVVFLGAVLLYIENSPVKKQTEIESMSSSAEENRAAFAAMNHSAFIVGHTGEVGKEVVKEAVKVFSRVVLIGRRQVQLEGEEYKNVEQKIVNFDKLDEHAESFKDIDVGFCCLGTTRGKSGADGFYKVDHDYVVNTARLAKQGGCSQFHLVSSQGASKNSWFLYPKTKGEVEEELKQMSFPKLYIYRPGMLLCDREESRPLEHVARAVFKPISAMFPTSGSIPTATVAKGIINAAVSPTEEPVQLFENKAIHIIAGTLNKKNKEQESK